MSQLDKSVIAGNFNHAAPHYEQYAVLQKIVGERLLERLDLVKIFPQLVIDLGSGAGTTARVLAKRFKSASVLQIDLSLGMLLQSHRKSRRFFSRQHYLCADAEFLPLKNDLSELLFSSLTFQWCNDLDRVFTEIQKVLMPGGMLLFATLGPDTLKELRQSWQAADDNTHVNIFFDMHDIGDALVRAGMTGVVMDTENITLTYPDCYALMRDLKNVGALNANSDRRRGLTGKKKMQEMVSAYEKFRNNNVLPATYEIVYGHAWASADKHSNTSRGGTVFVPVEKIGRRK